MLIDIVDVTEVVYLMHWPIPLPATDNTDEMIPLLPNGDRHLLDEKEWMEKFLRQGKTKAIGVSNMSIPYLEKLISQYEIIPIRFATPRGKLITG
jgi:glycerol 2-dehydrogenase (NADP+)